jgi:hypothetical protein
LGVRFPSASFFERLLIDITVVSPFEGTESGKLRVPAYSGEQIPENLHEKRAKRSKKKKIKHYAKSIEDYNKELQDDANHPEHDLPKAKFIPVVMYNTGKIHDEGKKLIKDLAAHGSELRKIPENTLYNFYLKIISIKLIKAIARIISTKALSAFSGNTANPRRALRRGNFEAHEVGDPNLFLYNQHSRND